jgi:hypothetical protein
VISLATSIASSQQAGGGNVDLQVSEYARVLLQPGKAFNAESVLSMPVPYRDRLSGARPEITHLWLWPHSAQVTAAVRYQKNLFSKKEEFVPFSAGAPLEPAKAGGVELRAKAPVFCSDEHRKEARYRLGQLEGLTIAARTGLANGLVVRVRAHPEADVTRPTDPQAPLVAVAGRRLVLSPSWVQSAEREGLILSAFPAQAASGVEFLDDWQIQERIWAILGENPALQPYLSWLKIEVQDGVAYLSGRLPEARLRNSAKQDIWHVPGVMAIEDALRVEGD